MGNDLKELEKSLTYMTLANVEAMKKKENIEVELDKLQDYVLSLQQEGFNQVVWKANFFYGLQVQVDFCWWCGNQGDGGNEAENEVD